MKKKYDVWIDNVKLFACTLVAVGHFLQSMVAAEILESNSVYHWFITTIYYFHVQLFFVCSGYLYQKNSIVTSVPEWKRNVKKKLLTLGVPYLAFSCITWLLKTVFADSVNNAADGLVYCLLLHPQSPYWYLYALFFLFAITPTFTDRKSSLITLMLALLGKILSVYGVFKESYLFNVILSNEIWFVSGMVLCAEDIPNVIRNQKSQMFIGSVLGITFLVFSVLVEYFVLKWHCLEFLLGMIACTSVLMIIMRKNSAGRSKKPFSKISQYIMPIFLMHTIFAAGVRSCLLKFGIDNLIIHTVFGIFISFTGPMVAAEIMKRIKWMEFLLYPGKFIRIS